VWIPAIPLKNDDGLAGAHPDAPELWLRHTTGLMGMNSASPLENDDGLAEIDPNCPKLWLRQD